VPSATTAACRPAAAPSHPASGYVSSQQLCESENCAANADVRSSGGATRRINRPVGVSTIEQAAPKLAHVVRSPIHRQPPFSAAVMAASPTKTSVSSWAPRNITVRSGTRSRTRGSKSATTMEPAPYAPSASDTSAALRPNWSRT
jgi:hypothetical protein